MISIYLSSPLLHNYIDHGSPVNVPRDIQRKYQKEILYAKKRGAP
jgi:hypothetical protein